MYPFLLYYQLGLEASQSNDCLTVYYTFDAVEPQSYLFRLALVKLSKMRETWDVVNSTPNMAVQLCLSMMCQEERNTYYINLTGYQNNM